MREIISLLIKLKKKIRENNTRITNLDKTVIIFFF